LFAVIGFTLFSFSQLVPSPVLTTYLKFKKMRDLEIAAFHGFSPLVGIIGTYILPFLLEKFEIKPVSLVLVWTLSFLACSTILQLFILPAVGVDNLTEWIMLAPVLIMRAPQWSIEFLENQLIKNYVPKGDASSVKSVLWMCSNAIQILGYVVALVVCYTRDFKYLAAVSIAFILIGSITYTVWVSVHGKDINKKVQGTNQEEDEDTKEKETYMNNQDLDMDNPISISSESDQ